MCQISSLSVGYMKTGERENWICSPSIAWLRYTVVTIGLVWVTSRATRRRVPASNRRWLERWNGRPARRGPPFLHFSLLDSLAVALIDASLALQRRRPARVRRNAYGWKPKASGCVGRQHCYGIVHDNNMCFLLEGLSGAQNLALISEPNTVCLHFHFWAFIKLLQSRIL